MNVHVLLKIKQRITITMFVTITNVQLSDAPKLASTF